MTERERLFAVRCELEGRAFDLMSRKNQDYSTEAEPLANYDFAAVVAGTTPARYIAGRMAEKAVRLGIVLARGGSACGESAQQELVDLQNFPGLIAYALEREAQR